MHRAPHTDPLAGGGPAGEDHSAHTDHAGNATSVWVQNQEMISGGIGGLAAARASRSATACSSTRG